MKFAGAICEYNPLHNGHLKHLNFIKENLDCDYTVIIMSGNFTERGEAAVTDKYTRAIHAVKSGADIVIELPTVFATSGAEKFAEGGVKIFNSLIGEKTLAFGSESGDLTKIEKIGYALKKESKEFKSILKSKIESGESFAKARQFALEKTLNFPVNDLLSSSNDILAVEYVKAILKNGYDINYQTLKREGSNYNDLRLNGGVSSASAIRNAILNGNLQAVKKEVPDYVFKDLPESLIDMSEIEYYSLLSTPKSELKKIADCTEGLENRLKSLLKDCLNTDEVIEKAVTKRYTESRIRRIILNTALKINADDVKSALKSPLYLKVLAINGNRENLLSDLAKNSKAPVITRKSDLSKLKGTSFKIFEKDVFALDLYNSLSGKKTNEFDMKIVK